MLWPAFNDIGGAGTVFTRHPHADDQTSDKHGDVAWRKAAGQRPGREENDAGDHCQTTPVAVTHSAEHQAAEPARDKGCGDQTCRLHRREPEFTYTSVSTRAIKTKSKPSSRYPNQAAENARHCARLRWRYHGIFWVVVLIVSLRGGRCPHALV